MDVHCDFVLFFVILCQLNRGHPLVTVIARNCRPAVTVILGQLSLNSALLMRRMMRHRNLKVEQSTTPSSLSSITYSEGYG